MRRLAFYGLSVLAVFFCFRPGFAEEKRPVTLRFNIIQDQVIYEESDYGEPPQVAIWLEDPVTGKTRTIYVTYRTATGNFKGKVECPVALPIWIGVYRKEFGREGFPTPRSLSPEAITRATSKTGLVTAEVEVPLSSRWRYYIEMNVAGDFNRHFPLETEDHRLDYHGNAQPSLVYRGEITAEPGNRSTPQPVGRSDQYQFTSEMITDLKGMDSALECFKSIEVECLRR
ncbi:MAG TPA: hypothetical protein VM123_03410 [archaeon]|nr:hypothetical protein [archaeon]